MEVGDSQKEDMFSKYCSSCGHKNPINARYCLKCGKKLIILTTLEDPEPEEGIHCPACRKRSPQGSSFCMWCGNDFSERPRGVKLVYCPKCGTENEPSAHFCISCKYNFVQLFNEFRKDLPKQQQKGVAISFPVIHLSPSTEYPDTAKLMVHGNEKTWFYLFAKPQIMFGRDRKNDIVLRLFPYQGEGVEVEDNIAKIRHISRTHFMISSDASGIYHTDYSINGTAWNGEVIGKGNKIQILDDGIISIVNVMDLRCKLIGRKGDIADALWIQRVGNLSEEGYILFYKELTIGGNSENGIPINTGNNSARIVCNGKRYMLACANGEIIINGVTKLTPHDKPYELPQGTNEPMAFRLGEKLIEFSKGKP